MLLGSFLVARLACERRRALEVGAAQGLLRGSDVVVEDDDGEDGVVEFLGLMSDDMLP